ncbi:MAG: gamma-glutamyl-gamma-aminobutyrate hydrolase family protein [Actinomycetota bacterium]|nr:gamma-glutamyl-gamma-aminobutyrate hydrolase family protein [Actinomycetota bacterium]
MRPVVGVTTYVEPASWGVWSHVPAALLPHAYVRQLEQAGAVVMLVPPREDADDALAHEVLDRLDGLVIAGGPDVDPARYGASPHPSVQAPRPDRDELELRLARASATRDLPVLGICRGMQVMAVAAGGGLEQHLPDRPSSGEHAGEPGVYASHPVTTAGGSRIAQAVGERLDVPSYHHQGVLTHPGYRPSAWAPDGTLEAFEDPEHAFRVAVQWHPEVGDDPRLFLTLVAAAGVVAARRS